MMVVVLVMRFVAVPAADPVAPVAGGRRLTRLDTALNTARFDAAPARLRHDEGQRRSESKNEGRLGLGPRDGRDFGGSWPL